VQFPDGTKDYTGIPDTTDPSLIPPGLISKFLTAPLGTQLGVRQINLTYNLADQTITGSTSDGVSVSGVAGKIITLSGGSLGYPDLAFTVSVNTPIFPPSPSRNDVTGSRLGDILGLIGGGQAGVAHVPVLDMVGDVLSAPIADAVFSVEALVDNSPPGFQNGYPVPISVAPPKSPLSSIVSLDGAFDLINVKTLVTLSV
jgi:hypothetical protein